ncbi:hypothetical protein OR1_03651 [Geobacter sp. OR-1]|uniref:hypothetical protein n=1 Tax=Geobacter sp. OR-1 TaxID=1266765 RepID=UPI000541CB10|nr:hypothetical protein [Geobacter sp. OR-1]GAM11338.1 hypothetical protein OR1_03651 [Geobacter sp. OR-1]
MPIFTKICQDLLPANNSFPGKYREADGTLMHGVYLREYKKTFHRLLIRNGHFMRKYRYPKIDAKFQSTMVNDHNLYLCGGWMLKGLDYKCITRVIEGVKPMGAFCSYNESEIEPLLEMCFKSGLPYRSTIIKIDDRINYDIVITAKGTFGEVFDLTSLQLDYMSYVNASSCPDKERECLAITALISSLHNKNISDYLEYDYANPKGYLDYILVGLMLGYPIETTVSLIY